MKFNCLYCKKECREVYRDSEEIDYTCSYPEPTCRSNFTLKRGDSTILYIFLFKDKYKITLSPKGSFLVLDRHTSAMILNLDYCPENITPENVLEKIKLYLMFQ